MREESAECFWRKEAGAVARRVNAGWWVERLNPLVVGGFLALATVALAARTAGADLRLAWLVAACGAVIGVGAAFAWWLGRARFIGPDEGLARLDDRLTLRNRLVSAAVGVGAWPPSAKGAARAASPSWRWWRALLPSSAAALVLAAAWLVPFPQGAAPPELAPAAPAAWQQMEEWLAALSEEDLIAEESLESLADRIEELRSQPEEEWFSHGSLEATDHLRESLGRDLSELARDLAAAERDIEALRRFGNEMSEDAKAALLTECEEALKGIEANAMALDETLSSELSRLDPSQLSEQGGASGLSQEALDALQERLRQGAASLGSIEGLPELAKVEDGADQLRPLGSGDIGKDGESAPLTFGREQDLGTNQTEGVENTDFSRAALGDFVGLGETEHDDERLEAALRPGGAPASTGSGGEAVWRDALLPEEQALLRRYFP